MPAPSSPFSFRVERSESPLWRALFLPGHGAAVGVISSDASPPSPFVFSSSRVPVRHSRALGVDRGNRKLHPGVRRRTPATGVHGATMESVFSGGPRVSFVWCRPSLDGWPGLEVTPSGCNRLMVDPWTRCTASTSARPPHAWWTAPFRMRHVERRKFCTKGLQLFENQRKLHIGSKQSRFSP